MFKPVIPDDARPFLELQQGALWDIRADRLWWDRAYQVGLNLRFAQLEGWLPSGGVGEILDVGGGMGGFSALLAQHYGQPGVTILDGVMDEPKVRKHDETFSNAVRAGGFLAANGVKRATFLDANALPDPERDKFDLVVSQQAWGFYFEPAKYLRWVMASCRNGAIVVLDLRRDASHWAVQLFSQHCLEPQTEIDPGEDAKYTIAVFQVDRGRRQ